MVFRMNDYWNDTPKQPEPPACPNDRDKCEGLGEYLYDGKTGMVFSCDTCAYQWAIPYPADPEPDDMGSNDNPEPAEWRRIVCPHGKIESCDACDHLGDIAYDSARERRYFGR